MNNHTYARRLLLFSLIASGIVSLFGLKEVIIDSCERKIDKDYPKICVVCDACKSYDVDGNTNIYPNCKSFILDKQGGRYLAKDTDTGQEFGSASNEKDLERLVTHFFSKELPTNNVNSVSTFVQ